MLSTTTATLLTLLLASAAPLSEHGPAGAHMAQVGRPAAHWDADSGAFLGLSADGTESLLPASRLWRVVFADGSAVGDSAAPGTDACRLESLTRAEDGTARLLYGHQRMRVLVTVSPAGGDALAFRLEVLESESRVSRVELPWEARIPVENLERVVFPQRSSESLGVALHRSFFMAHGEDSEARYGQRVVGPSAYARVFGDELGSHPDRPAAVALELTDAGRALLPAQLQRELSAARLVVNRPSPASHLDRIWVTSADGPLLGAASLGGRGLLLRFCGNGEGTAAEDLHARLITAVTEGLARGREESFRGRRIGIVQLRNGPTNGAWTPTPVADWQAFLGRCEPVAAGACELEILETPAALRQALAGDRHALILNPYGEWLPTGDVENWAGDVDAIREYVRRGGLWWEVGGYPFFYVLCPEPYLQYTEAYPPAVADLAHAAFQDGSGLAFMGIQPLMDRPWQGREEPERLCVPGDLTVGGDETGAFYRHTWHVDLAPGQGWRSPEFRVATIPTPEASARVYAEAIGLDRLLSDKLGPAFLDRLAAAVLVRLHGATAAEQTQALPLLPRANIVHIAEYLHGGFDKQYPDHLPPRPDWGSAAELQAFYREAKDLGHLVMPYTNTSWWCIEPRGPTFEASGEAPLARTPDGGLQLEDYAGNRGYRVCYWHDSVHRAHRRTVTQMTQEFESDILLQDQVGARGWYWDYNPAAPTPTAAIDGLHSLSMEDAALVPLATEDGYDRVAQFESMCCGMAWGTVPSSARNLHRLNRNRFPAGDWTFYPLFSFLAHDKTVFALHDLGHFVTDVERQAYTVALGYSMSYACSPATLRRPETVQWLTWLDRVQKSVCRRYTGQPLLAYDTPVRDERGRPSAEVFATDYGTIRAVANVSGSRRQVRDCVPGELPSPGWTQIELAAPGFLAWGEGVTCGFVDGRSVWGTGFALETMEGACSGLVWARPDEEVLIPVSFAVTEDRGFQARRVGGGAWAPVARLPAVSGLLRMRLPSDGSAGSPAPLHLRTAPVTDPESSRELLVLAPEGVPTTWVRVTPDQWLAQLRATSALEEAGCRVRRVTSLPAFYARLTGPVVERPFCVINPCGEFLPVTELESARACLDAVRTYIEQGGVWWETGGYSFHAVCAPRPNVPGAWDEENIGPNGAVSIGFACAGHPVESPPRPLRVTALGRQWLGPQVTALVEARTSGVQRPFSTVSVDSSLVTGGSEAFAAAIRPQGGGWLWRLGGFDPDPDAARAIVAAVVLRLATQPWPPASPRPPLLWECRQSE